MVITACNNCHRHDLKGNASGTTPNLVIHWCLSVEAFYHFIKRGQGRPGRENVGKMSELARNHFRYFNESQINPCMRF
jgi:hypothetical protein